MMMMMMMMMMMRADCGMKSADTCHSCETVCVVNRHLATCVVTNVFDYSGSLEKKATPAYPSFLANVNSCSCSL